MDGPAYPLDLGRPGDLDHGIGLTRGGQGEVWLTVAPLRQPLVERKGFLGRRKQEPAGWCLAAQDWADSTATSEWTIWCVLPAGAPLSRRGVALPEGATVETETELDALLRLPVGCAESTVAGELCRLATALIVPWAPGGWFWRVGDSFLPYYRP